MADSSRATLSFRALQLANEQRSLYGLRYHDFERYRKHCANRTHRLRSTLKLTHGKGREFKKHPPTPLDKIQDGHLQLTLLEAERAWSYSQELLALASQPANDEKASALRHNATGRFRRAVHWATQLLSQCQTLYSAGRLPAQGLLEITAYTLILNGRFLRYRDEFDDALIQLGVAKSLLDELANQAETSRDQALATYFADEVGPEIRYCAHELGNTKAYDVDNIVAEVAGQHRAQLVDGYEQLVQKLRGEGASAGKDQAKKKLGALLWEGEPVPVRNPELVDVLLKVQEGEAKLKHESAEASQPKTGEQKKKGKAVKGSKSKRGVAAYDNILLALSDAEEVARKLVEAQQLSGAASSLVAGARDIGFVHTYIVYHLLARRIQRDLLLISTLLSSQHAQNKRHSAKGKSVAAEPSKPHKEQVDVRLFPALVKLLDTVLQSLNQMRALPIVDESPDLATAVDARISFTSARRCMYLARAYVPIKKFGEALILLQRGQIHLRETRSVLSTIDTDLIATGDPAFYLLAPADVDSLDSDLTADALRFKTEWFAYNGGSLSADNKAYKKPLFFDIALNYVQLDMDRLQERAGKKPQPQVAQPRAVPVAPAADKRPSARPKLEEEIRAPTPEPSAPSKGGLSSLLGGWWGKQ
ncbi:hypothetical protein FA95DRAFT_1566349 [Auriscalpium vulgare]|uniref:Uncharacterized protein n=1 Tax=Auriscalpium vulgare TaxID=40419 RepID=A0ACB8R921_9AGAM|nr:hypothetical protein FA95DRAFT_1566349 [Auriscalpium vulgare]